MVSSTCLLCSCTLRHDHKATKADRSQHLGATSSQDRKSHTLKQRLQIRVVAHGVVAHNTRQRAHATHTTRAAPTHTATSGRRRTAPTWQLNTDDETFPIGTREYTQRHGARLYAPSQFDMRAHQQRYNGRSSPLSVQIPATCFSVSPSSNLNILRTHRTFGLGGLCKSSAQSVGNLDKHTHRQKKIGSADVTDKTNKRGPNGTAPLLLLPHQYDFTLTLMPHAL